MIDPNLPITYIGSPASPYDNDLILGRLWLELDWLRHPGVPRREYFVSTKGEPYTYGTPPHARTYYPQLWSDTLLSLRGMAEFAAGCSFDVCFLNGYEDERDQLGWHSDDSPEMDDTRPIVIMTFGAERDIMFRERPEVWEETNRDEWAQPQVYTRRLEHGSICIMHAGMQDTHQHRIPKAGFKCGKRVSLTFRGLA